jgi:hypothetical protein
MGDSALLETVGRIERAATLPALVELLNEVVTEEDLVPYSEAIGDQPRFEPFGDVRDALQRVEIDRGATDQFARDVCIGALIRVVVAQQQRIDAQDERIRALEAQATPQQRSSRARAAKS